jgi:hypothetical protein
MPLEFNRLQQGCDKSKFFHLLATQKIFLAHPNQTRAKLSFHLHSDADADSSLPVCGI